MSGKLYEKPEGFHAKIRCNLNAVCASSGILVFFSMLLAINYEILATFHFCVRYDFIENS